MSARQRMKSAIEIGADRIEKGHQTEKGRPSLRDFGQPFFVGIMEVIRTG